MNLLARITSLPERLRFAVRIWIGIALLTMLLPASAVDSVGLLAYPWFWALLLPLLAVLPFQQQLLPRKPAVDARQRRNRQESMRHTRAPQIV